MKKKAANTKLVKENAKANQAKSGKNNQTYLKLVITGLLFIFSLSVSFNSIEHKKQFEQLGGMAEEYNELAANIFEHDTFGLNDSPPSYFRPPGYAYFLSKAIAYCGGLPDFSKIQTEQEFFAVRYQFSKKLFRIQAFVFSLTCVLVFIWLTELLPLLFAALLAASFTFCPYFYLFNGFFHYETLHVFFLVLAGYSIHLAIRHKNYSATLFFVSGIILGLTTLVRPLTLIIPAFVFIALIFILKKQWLDNLKYTLILALGMTVVIAPWTYRNYKLTQKIIPVNAQANSALWGSTVVSLPYTSNYFRWWINWRQEGLSLFQQTTDSVNYSTPAWYKHNLKLEEEFGKKAMSNLKSNPGIYAGNVLKNTGLILFNSNSVLIKIFESIQSKYQKPSKTWITYNNPQTFFDSGNENLFSFSFLLLTIAGLAGIYFGCRYYLNLITPALILFACMAFAHAITYMDLMYFYFKMPFLFLFSAFTLKYFIDNKIRFKQYYFGVLFLVTLPILINLVLTVRLYL